MNNDPATGSTVPGSDPPADDADTDLQGVRLEVPDDDDIHTGARSRSQSRSRRRRKKKSKKDRNPGLVKKLSFVTHLLKTLDLLVFAELSGLYYMECSIVRFLIRAVGQYMYLTPKDESFPFLMPAGRVHVLLVVIPNFICIVLHIFFSLPKGPDFHRGYQHGGLIIDFVGQRPPTSRIYYLFADFAILALQCLMLTVHTQREQLRVLLKTFRPLVPELAEEMEAAVRSAQDLDAEERGVSIHETGAPVGDDADANGVGMPPSLPAEGSTNTIEGSEVNGEASEGLLREDSSGETASRSQLADIMNSGNAVLGEYYMVQSVVSAAGDLERTAAHSLRSISYGATLATLQARRRAALAQSASIRPDR